DHPADRGGVVQEVYELGPRIGSAESCSSSSGYLGWNASGRDDVHLVPLLLRLLAVMLTFERERQETLWCVDLLLRHRHLDLDVENERLKRLAHGVRPQGHRAPATERVLQHEVEPAEAREFVTSYRTERYR